jgi:protein ImuB
LEVSGWILLSAEDRQHEMLDCSYPFHLRLYLAMRLWIGLHLPQLSLEALEPHWSSNPDSISVVLEQEKVLALSRAARAAGVKPAMRRGGVLMLAPDARIHERSPTSEAEALQVVAVALLQYTPCVTLAEEGVILADVGASLALFKGVRALCRRVREDVRNLGFTGRLSCAPTARAAWMLARSGGGRVLKQETMSRSLNRLPAVVPVPARPHASWLEGIGCDTVGQLRRLPRPGLQRRCGRALLDVLDSAFGTAPELFEWIELPDKFEAKLELFGRIEQAELLLTGAQRLVIQLVGWLTGKLMAAEGITLKLEMERGKFARPPQEIEILLAGPVWQGEHIIRLLKERLAKVELTAPVIGLVLEVTKLQALAPGNQSLFVDEGQSEEDQVKTLELLVARLGPDRVLQPKPVADYRPEVANAWVPITKKLREATVRAELPPNVTSMQRPMWLLAKPIPLLMRSNRPYYTSSLRMVAGPERVEAGWWSGTAARDYFIAQGESFELLWVYRERVFGDDAEPRWFLHGLFG